MSHLISTNWHICTGKDFIYQPYVKERGGAIEAVQKLQQIASSTIPRGKYEGGTFYNAIVVAHFEVKGRVRIYNVEESNPLKGFDGVILGFYKSEEGILAQVSVNKAIICQPITSLEPK